jgi:hypothetical protein
MRIMRQEPGKMPALHAGYDEITLRNAVQFLDRAAQCECEGRPNVRYVAKDGRQNGLLLFRRHVVGAEGQTLVTFYLDVPSDPRQS